MTTEDLIEEVIELGVKAYKKNSSGSAESVKLNRHESIIIDGIEFSYWREYVVYKIGEYIKDEFPTIEIEVNLDGNNSNIVLSLNDDEQKLLNTSLYTFLKKIGEK